MIAMVVVVLFKQSLPLTTARQAPPPAIDGLTMKKIY
jgi:hypothetical protein